MRVKPSPPVSDEQEMRRVAMSWLARRDFARKELSDRLTRRFPQGEVGPVLDWLQAQRYIDDERFAEVFFRSRLERGHGPLRIRQDMRQKGLEDQPIQACLDNTEVDFAVLASQVRQRRFGPPPLGDDKARARQLRFLQYRGFTGEQCFAALEAVPLES